jgi:hypothetical protein
MNQETEQVQSNIFGSMIGALTGQHIDTKVLDATTRTSARHNLWEGPDAFDADEPQAHRNTQH